jgi:hypothetical protein
MCVLAERDKSTLHQSSKAAVGSPRRTLCEQLLKQGSRAA